MSLVPSSNTATNGPRLVLNGGGDVVAKLSPSTDEYHVHVLACVRPKGAPGAGPGPEGSLEVIVRRSQPEGPRGTNCASALMQVAVRAMDGTGKVVAESQVKGPMGSADAAEFYDICQQQARECERLKEALRSTVGEDALREVLAAESGMALKKSDLLASWRAGAGGELQRAREEAQRWRVVAQERLEESDTLRSELLKLRQSVVDTETDDLRMLEELQAALEARDQDIKELNQDCTVLIEEVTRLRAMLANRQGQLTALTTEVNGLRRSFYASLAEGKHLREHPEDGRRRDSEPPPVPVGSRPDPRTGDPAFLSDEPSAESPEGAVAVKPDPLAELRKWRARQDERMGLPPAPSGPSALADPRVRSALERYVELGRKRAPTQADLIPTTAKGEQGQAQGPSVETAGGPVEGSGAQGGVANATGDLEGLMSEALVLEAVQREKVRAFGAAIRNSYHAGLLKSAIRTWSRTASESRSIRAQIVRADQFRARFQRRIFFQAWRRAARMAVHQQVRVAQARLKAEERMRAEAAAKAQLRAQAEAEASRELRAPALRPIAIPTSPARSLGQPSPSFSTSSTASPFNKGRSATVPGPAKSFKTAKTATTTSSAKPRDASPGPLVRAASNLHDAPPATLAAAAASALMEAAAARMHKASEDGSSAPDRPVYMVNSPMSTGGGPSQSLMALAFQNMMNGDSDSEGDDGMNLLSPRTIQLRLSQLSSTVPSTQRGPPSRSASPAARRPSDPTGSPSPSSQAFGFEAPGVKHSLKKLGRQPGSAGPDTGGSSGRRTQRSTFDDFLQSSDTPAAQALARHRSTNSASRNSEPVDVSPRLLSPHVMQINFSQLSSGIGTEEASGIDRTRSLPVIAQNGGVAFTVPSLGSLSLHNGTHMYEGISAETPSLIGGKGDRSLRQDLERRLEEAAGDEREGSQLDVEYSLGQGLGASQDISFPGTRQPTFVKPGVPTLPPAIPDDHSVNFGEGGSDPVIPEDSRVHDAPTSPVRARGRGVHGGRGGPEDDAGARVDASAEKEEKVREVRKKIWRFRASSLYRQLTAIFREWSALASQAAAQRHVEEYERRLLGALSAARGEDRRPIARRGVASSASSSKGSYGLQLDATPPHGSGQSIFDRFMRDEEDLQRAGRGFSGNGQSVNRP